SKAVLEDTLGHEVRHLAYPHGYNSPAVRRAAAAAGYTSAVAVRHALSSGRDEIYRIARLIVRRTHTTADVEQWMEGRGARTAPYPDSPLTVGWRMYRRTRALVRGAEFAG
ncbi:polysaccharide deacetylase family protein, partial [Streptomyces albidoflavus]